MYYADFLLQKNVIIEINGSHHYTHIANQDFNLNFVKHSAEIERVSGNFLDGKSKFNASYIQTFDVEESKGLNMKSIIKNQYLLANGYKVLMIRSDIIELLYGDSTGRRVLKG